MKGNQTPLVATVGNYEDEGGLGSFQTPVDGFLTPDILLLGCGLCYLLETLLTHLLVSTSVPLFPVFPPPGMPCCPMSAHSFISPPFQPKLKYHFSLRHFPMITRNDVSLMGTPYLCLLP